MRRVNFFSASSAPTNVSWGEPKQLSPYHSRQTEMALIEPSYLFLSSFPKAGSLFFSATGTPKLKTGEGSAAKICPSHHNTNDNLLVHTIRSRRLVSHWTAIIQFSQPSCKLYTIITPIVPPDNWGSEDLRHWLRQVRRPGGGVRTRLPISLQSRS